MELSPSAAATVKHLEEIDLQMFGMADIILPVLTTENENVDEILHFFGEIVVCRRIRDLLGG